MRSHSQQKLLAIPGSQSDKRDRILVNMQNSRQLAFVALRNIHRQGAFADFALDRVLQSAKLNLADRGLLTELVYGCVRRMRSLDAVIDHFAKKSAQQQPPDLRTILHIGLYQLQYLDRIPAATAVDTTVELAKQNGFTGLAGFVNGLMRQYLRQSAGLDILSQITTSIDDPVEKSGILYSFPNWIISNWIEQVGLEETAQLCEWFNLAPNIDLRVNPLQTTLEQVESALQSAGVRFSRMPYLPQALRLTGSVGAIQNLPGYDQGWWTIQDSSAQLVSYLLDPQPGEVIIDACAAPGGKTTQIAELMSDRGTIWACDKTPSRLKKLRENAERLQLKSISILTGDSRNFPQFEQQSDRVLLDAPCSGLGTLHRRADARWRQTQENIAELSLLQQELLAQTAQWVKPGGILVYATCTVHPLENEQVIEKFLCDRPNWQIEPPSPDSIVHHFCCPEGWVKVWPHRHQMDGFFMVRLKLRPS